MQLAGHCQKILRQKRLCLLKEMLVHSGTQTLIAEQMAADFQFVHTSQHHRP